MVKIILLILGFSIPVLMSAQTAPAVPAVSDSIVVQPYRGGLEIDGETIICPGATTVLKVRGLYEKYEWSNGSQTPAIPVFKPGTYEVTVTTKGGCRLTGSVTVRYSESPCL